MPVVLCGIPAFQKPTSGTAAAVAEEFSASLDPGLHGAGCLVEVYRLQKVTPEEVLSEGEPVVCRLPDWGFDLCALEELHRQLDDAAAEREDLQVQYARTKEALMALSATLEGPSEVHSSQEGQPPPSKLRALEGGGRDTGESSAAQEVWQLRQQLLQSEKKQQETKASVLALRSEFIHLVSVMGDVAGPSPVSLSHTGKDYNATAAEYLQEVERLAATAGVRDASLPSRTARDASAHGVRQRSHGPRRPGSSAWDSRSPAATGTGVTPKQPSARSKGPYQHSSGHKGAGGASWNSRYTNNMGPYSSTRTGWAALQVAG
mmetsp:Transcript_3578/g.7855  ORF Transcript_3578/g.7855 Transcript_3578/m.7855 type:complete len:319 (+) Transcript_3578:131-1087(+)